MPEIFSNPLPLTLGAIDPSKPLELFEQPLPVYFPGGGGSGQGSKVTEDPNDPGTFIIS